MRTLPLPFLASVALALAPAAALAASPTVVTRAAADVTTTAATLRATVDPNGKATTYAFQYGRTTAYGSQTASRSAGADDAGAAVQQRLRGLTPGVRYHYRVIATNADGTTVGADRSFRTALPPARPPAVLGTAPFAPYANSVTLTALLNPGAATTTYRFQLGTTTAYGLETFAKTLRAGVTPQSVSIPVSGLQPRTTYHFRVVASNRAGTTIGPDTLVTTGPFPPARLAVGTRPDVQRRSHPYFIVSGVLRLPPGVSVADGCGGLVGVRFTSRRSTVAFRRVRMADDHCSFRVRMRAAPPAGRELLRVRAHFYGNAILTPFDARSFLVRFK